MLRLHVIHKPECVNKVLWGSIYHLPSLPYVCVSDGLPSSGCSEVIHQPSLCSCSYLLGRLLFIITWTLSL